MWSRQDLLSSRAWDVLIVRYRDGGSQGAARSIARGWWAPPAGRDDDVSAVPESRQPTWSSTTDDAGHPHLGVRHVRGLRCRQGREPSGVRGGSFIRDAHDSRCFSGHLKRPGAITLVAVRWCQVVSGWLMGSSAGAQRGHKQESIRRQWFSSPHLSAIGRSARFPASPGRGQAQGRHKSKQRFRNMNLCSVGPVARRF